MASVSISIWEKAAPPPFVLKPDNSVPFHISLVLFELLFQCLSSKQVSLSKYVCKPLGNAGDSTGPLSPSTSIIDGFYSQLLWRILFLSLESWVWISGVMLVPLASQGGLLQLS